MERQSHISRRDFLKLLGAGAASLALSNVKIESVGAIENSPLTPEKIDFLATHPITYGDKKSKMVMMTYDDGPAKENLEKILKAYKDNGAKCTFFLTGRSMEVLGGDILNQIVNEGHLLEWHSYTHPEKGLPSLKESKIKEEFEKWFEVQKKFLPNYVPKFWRAPGGTGSSNKRLLRIAAEYGLQHVGWSASSGGQTDKSFGYVFRDFGTYQKYRKADGGVIVLSHVQRPYDMSQASAIIQEFQKRGYQLVTVDQGMDPADKWVDPAIKELDVDRLNFRV